MTEPLSPKPHGPIPPYFSADGDGMMCIGGQRVDRLIASAGDTPLFVYDVDVVRQRLHVLRSAMPDGLGIHYAIKANSLPAFLDAVRPMVDGFDVASGGELAKALAAGMPAEQVSFAGPGKRDRELADAIEAGSTINLESAGEAQRALAAAERLGITPRLAVRVNPDFDLRGSGMRMGGGAKPFGIDSDVAPTVIRMIIDAGADWRGLHIFAGSQALDADAIIDTQRQTIALADALCGAVGVAAPVVNLGGGLGVPYFPNDVPVDPRPIGAALAESLARSELRGAGCHFAMELGRYIAADCGVYLMRVVDRKFSHGQTFLVTDGGLHHQLAASGNFGTVIRRNYPIAIANQFGKAGQEVVHVVGCLCTPLDRLGDQVLLPQADVGDIVALFMAGAYGASASPAAFLGHPAPLEMVIDGQR